MNSPLYTYLPELDMQEMTIVQSIVKDYDDKQVMDFANMYRSRRRDPQMILLSGLAGFLGFAGIQRFLTDNIGMGILYFFTAGLCFIGTIMDLVNHRQIALEYNMKVAREVASWLTSIKK